MSDPQRMVSVANQSQVQTLPKTTSTPPADLGVASNGGGTVINNNTTNISDEDPTIVVAALDGAIPAPTAMTISRVGSSSSPVFAVPAGKTKLRLRSPALVSLNSVSADIVVLGLSNLLVIDQTAGAVLTPNAQGHYTVVPGNNVSLSQTVLSYFCGDFSVSSTTAADWGVQFEYAFED